MSQENKKELQNRRKLPGAVNYLDDLDHHGPSDLDDHGPSDHDL